MRQWRMLPPGGSPLPFAALLRGLAAAPHAEQAEEAFAARLRHVFGMERAFFASSGRAALSLLFTALRRLNPERDEVLIPAYVSFSVPSAVVNAGCRVVLYDVDPETLSPEYTSLAGAFSERTLALVACHQFGLPFGLEAAAELCRRDNITLVDDAAQVMGGRVKGRPAGCLGDVGLFSLSRGKPMTAVDGGILLTSRPDIAAALDAAVKTMPRRRFSLSLAVKALALMLLRRPELYRLPASLPWLKLGASIFEPDFSVDSLSAFQAGMALAVLDELEGINAERRRKAAFYRQGLASLEQVRSVPEQPGVEAVYLRYPVLPANGDPLLTQGLLQNGRARELGISPGFPLSLDAVPGLRPHLVRPEQRFPGARLLAESLVTLPTHDCVRASDSEAVLACVAEAACGQRAKREGERT